MTGVGLLSLERTLSGLVAFHLDPRKDCEKPQLCGPVRYFREVGRDKSGAVSLSGQATAFLSRGKKAEPGLWSRK